MVANVRQLFPGASLQYTSLSDVDEKELAHARGHFEIIFYACAHSEQHLARVLRTLTSNHSYVLVPDAVLSQPLLAVFDNFGYMHYGDTDDCAVFERKHYISPGSARFMSATAA